MNVFFKTNQSWSLWNAKRKLLGVLEALMVHVYRRLKNFSVLCGPWCGQGFRLSIFFMKDGCCLKF